MRHRKPTPLQKLAADAGLITHHDTERDLLRLPDERSIEALLAAARNAQAWIVAFEGFTVHPDGVRPDMDAIADFSTCADASESLREAGAALRALRERDLSFEFDLRL